MRICAAALLCLLLCTGCELEPASNFTERGDSLHEGVSANVYPLSGSVSKEVYELKRSDRTPFSPKGSGLKNVNPEE